MIGHLQGEGPHFYQLNQEISAVTQWLVVVRDTARRPAVVQIRVHP